MNTDQLSEIEDRARDRLRPGRAANRHEAALALDALALCGEVRRLSGATPPAGAAPDAQRVGTVRRYSESGCDMTDAPFCWCRTDQIRMSVAEYEALTAAWEGT